MLPTLYTFRRCPYAMRARWAVHAAGVAVDQIEVSLGNKPAAMLAASPKGTVPVLVLANGTVIDQSLDVMLWALRQNDPEQWLAPARGSLQAMLDLIEACERDFKPHLDRYKYPSRFSVEWMAQDAEGDPAGAEAAFSTTHFQAAQGLLLQLAEYLAMSTPGDKAAYLFGPRVSLADTAIVPFVRQMARHDAERFAATAPQSVSHWMQAMLARADFEAIMRKPPAGTPP